MPPPNEPHVPKGYTYAAMAFAAFVEALNMFARRNQRNRDKPPAATEERRAQRVAAWGQPFRLVGLFKTLKAIASV